MDGATIQAKVYAGYAKAAQYVGLPFQQFRPTGAANPTSGTPRATLNASFSVAASTFNFGKGAAHKDVLFNALVDGSKVQVGDYLVGASDTYFVVSMQPLLPILAVRCNRVLTVNSPGPTTTFGANTAYSGTDGSNETAIMTAWPGSVMFDARGRATEVGLPTDLPSPFFQILLPTLSGIDVRSSCFITDDLSRRYTIAAAERSPLGWRLSAQQAVT